MALKHIENMAYKQKDEDALLTLGRMYLNGVGVKVDTDKAFACFKKLAKKYNNKDAYYYVGYMLAYGVGRTVNKKGAVKNIVKASELGSPIADYALSVMYAGGKFGLHQDLQKAAELKEKDTTKDICFVLFDASIEIDKELSNLLVGDITKERQISQIIPKQQESLYLCKEAAEAGCPEAMLSFGIKLLFGDGIEKDFEKARQMIERCLPYNVGMAYYALGYIYDIGLGVQQNCWTAYSYYKKASSLGEKCADVNIAYCNLHGFGCKCNQKKGYEMLKELSKDDNPYANYYLGLCYLNGYGCKVDSAKARDYFNMASTAKIARAYYNLGLLSDAKKNNVGLDENSAAVQNLNKAYELGDMDGAAILSAIYSKSTSGDDLDKAKKLNEMSVGNRSAEGYLEKAKKCMSGEIYAKNFNEADKFYRMAAIAGNREASRFLYESYENGQNGYPRDDKKAFEWLEQSGYNGDKSCYLNLAEKYFNGSSLWCEKNAEKSAYWYAKLVREGKNKKEVGQAKKMLSKFALDTNGNWNIKKDIDYMKKHGGVVAHVDTKPNPLYVELNKGKGNFDKAQDEKSEFENKQDEKSVFDNQQDNINSVENNQSASQGTFVTETEFDTIQGFNDFEQVENSKNSQKTDNLQETQNLQTSDNIQSKSENVAVNVVDKNENVAVNVADKSSHIFEDNFDGLDEFEDIGAEDMAVKPEDEAKKVEDNAIKEGALDDFFAMIGNCQNGDQQPSSQDNINAQVAPQPNNQSQQEYQGGNKEDDIMAQVDEKHKGKKSKKDGSDYKVDDGEKNKHLGHKHHGFKEVEKPTDSEVFAPKNKVEVDDGWGDLLDDNSNSKQTTFNESDNQSNFASNGNGVVEKVDNQNVVANNQSEVVQNDAYNNSQFKTSAIEEENFDDAWGDLFDETPVAETHIAESKNDNIMDSDLLNKGGLWTSEGRNIEEDFKETATNDDLNKIKSYDYNVEKDFDILEDKDKH